MQENSSLFQKTFVIWGLSDSELEKAAEAYLYSEKTLPDSAQELCRAASILHWYGIVKQKGRPLLMALNFLMQAEECDPHYLDSTFIWRHLWGNILVHLCRLVHDFSFVEKGLRQYAKADSIPDRKKEELYWDWAQAWTLLGLHSLEPSDLKKGLLLFQGCQCNSPLFQIDYAMAYVVYGMYTGEPSYSEEALVLLRGALADTYDSEGGVSLVHARAWDAYTSACKRRYFLTHLPEHLEEANIAYREAILTIPDHVDLWLEWGELYLLSGWLKHDLKDIEIGLDKLTASRAKEGDPLRLSALLGQGLLFLGLSHDDLKALQEARQRVQAALEIAPAHPDLITAAAFAELGMGVYFSDEKSFTKAVSYFEKGIEQNATTVLNWHGLFRTCLSWGTVIEDISLVRRGVQAIARVSQLRPHSSVFLNEWGIGLIQLKRFEKEPETEQALLEEAILKFKQAYQLQESLESLFNWGCALDLLGDLTGEEEDFEKAIAIFSQLYENTLGEPRVCYHLALALLHLGELTADVEYLRRSIELFEPLAQSDLEDASLWTDLGYALLTLSELICDPVFPEKGEELRREAEKRLLHAAEIGNGEANYYLACLYSLAKLTDSSIYFLKRADELNALPSQEDLVQDEWLANVRESDSFKQFIIR